jgi:hypothetical protein
VAFTIVIVESSFRYRQPVLPLIGSAAGTAQASRHRQPDSGTRGRNPHRRCFEITSVSPLRSRTQSLSTPMSSGLRFSRINSLFEFAGTGAAKSKRTQKHRNVIEVPWRKTPSTRRREVLVPESGATEARPVRSELGTLRPDPRNARTHPKSQVDQIDASIRQFGA